MYVSPGCGTTFFYACPPQEIETVSCGVPCAGRCRLRDGDETVLVVETAESWRCHDLRAQWRARRREMAGTVGRLHSKAPVRSAMVVGDVLADYAFGMAVATDDRVIEAAASNGSDHPLSKGICLGRSGRRGERANTEATNAGAKCRSKNRVAVMDEESRDMPSIDRGQI